MGNVAILGCWRYLPSRARKLLLLATFGGHVTSCRSKGSWLPATYLIPGCGGRGRLVGLGSESSCGSVLKSGIQTNPKTQILRLEILHAQNVGNVLISREKSLLTFCGNIADHFSMDRQMQFLIFFALFPFMGM